LGSLFIKGVQLTYNKKKDEELVLGFFKSIFGGLEGKISKKELIRELVKMRINRPALFSNDVSEHDVDRMGAIMLNSLPEGTIVTIIETYIKLGQQGLSDQEIFYRIDSRRPGQGVMPSPLTLSSFIQYRLDIEVKNPLIVISPFFIHEAVEVCLGNYGIGRN